MDKPYSLQTVERLADQNAYYGMNQPGIEYIAQNLARQLADSMCENERLRCALGTIYDQENKDNAYSNIWGIAKDALFPSKASKSIPDRNKHSLPDILKIQGDANMLLDGIIAIELYNDEIHYNGKIIYRGLYNRDDVDRIVKAYKDKQAKTSEANSDRCNIIQPHVSRPIDAVP